MATYLKTTSKLFDLPSRSSAELDLKDLMCPVCRGLLIEPVTLPCAHSLCLRCLNGTIQHNSLSCPLCRVRVGSWLRTATKSGSLVNDGLWKLIKTRFAREIQAKHDGQDTELDAGYVTTTNKILSAAGEIRREYEAQLQLAEEELRLRRETERLASEALIRKIQAKERQQINQLAKDHAMAKSLAKKQVIDKFSTKPQERLLPDERTAIESTSTTSDGANWNKVKDGNEWNSNIALISKLRAERYASEMKSGGKNAYIGSSEKFFPHGVTDTQNQGCRNQLSQPVSNISYLAKPSCSNSKIYGTQIKEELNVPSDVLNRKKKSLGVEVRLAAVENDRRIGSAESSGSHDSINIEIHHFKPIKAMPRTPLRTMPDGRQVDPKLIRVVGIMKRVQNAVLKPPTFMQLKRLSGCSYSAFKGKSKKISKQDIQRVTITNIPKEEQESKIATSTSASASASQIKLSGKSQILDTVRRLDLTAESSYDGNKNHTKNMNRMINGVKLSKKLILDEELEVARLGNDSTNGNGDNPVKFKCRKNSSNTDKNDVDQGKDYADESTCQESVKEEGQTSDRVPAVETIAERIKKRKMTRSGNDSSEEAPLKQRVDKNKVAHSSRIGSKKKRGKHRVIEEHIDEEEILNSDSVESKSQDSEMNIELRGTTTSRRLTRNSVKVCGETESVKTIRKFSENSVEDEDDHDLGVREQEAMERLVLQEKKDFELAQRLQAKFDEMERISGRTRGSRRGGAGGAGCANSKVHIEQVFPSGRRSAKTNGGVIGDRFTEQLLIIQDQEKADVKNNNKNNERRVTRRRCV